jgi:hypothetical protein
MTPKSGAVNGTISWILLSENKRKLICMGRTNATISPYLLKKCPKQFERCKYHWGFEPGTCKSTRSVPRLGYTYLNWLETMSFVDRLPIVTTEGTSGDLLAAYRSKLQQEVMTADIARLNEADNPDIPCTCPNCAPSLNEADNQDITQLRRGVR